jgi:hypothetical protein
MNWRLKLTKTFRQTDSKCYVNVRKQTHLYLIMFSIHSLYSGEYPNDDNVSLYRNEAADRSENVENLSPGSKFADLDCTGATFHRFPLENLRQLCL